MVLVTPVLLMMVVFVVFLGRLGQARNDVDRAARDAARAASMARAVEGAEAAGREAAHATLGSGGVSCRQMDVFVDTAAFGAGGTVSAVVSCTVDLSDASGLAVPGSTTLRGSFREPVDSYRGVRP